MCDISQTIRAQYGKTRFFLSSSYHICFKKQERVVEKEKEKERRRQRRGADRNLKNIIKKENFGKNGEKFVEIS